MENILKRNIDEIKCLKHNNKVLAERLDKGEKMIIESQKKMDESNKIDIMPLREKLENIEDINRKVDDNKEFNSLKGQCQSTNKQVIDIQGRMDSIKANIQSTIEGLTMPIKGLSMAAGEVLYNNIPIDQISDSEKLRVSMYIAMALNPKIRVIRMNEASLLDEESLAEVDRIARENDYQIWQEVVDSSGDVGIVIEDGEVVKVNEPVHA